MGKNKKNTEPLSREEETPGLSSWIETLWYAAFIALAFVPDQKILRHKLLSIEAGVALLAATCILRWTATERAVWFRTPLDVPVILYAVGGVFFYALSPEHGASTSELVRILFCALTFFTATQTLPLLKKISRLTAAWIISATGIALYTLLQLRGGWGALDVPYMPRPFATFGNPIFLSAYLSATLVIALTAAVATKGFRRNVWGICSLVLMGGVIAAQSRSAFAGLGGALLLAAMAYFDGKRRWTTAGVFALLGITGAIVFRSREWTHNLIWQDTLSLWKGNPFLGCGLGRFHIEFPAFASDALKSLWPQQKVIVNFAHNEYLQVLAETGIVGFGLFIFLIASAATWLIRTWKPLPSGTEKIRAGGFALAAAAVLGQNFFSPDIRFGLSSFILFFSLGAAVSISAHARPFLIFPGRLGFAALGMSILLAWSARAVEPLIAHRRLIQEPEFHAPRSERGDHALAALEKNLAENPDNADIAENLAFYYAKQKQWAHAISRFQLAARLAPTRPGPLNNLGNIHYMTGDKNGAIGYWEASLRVDPEQIDAHLNLGKTLYEVGRLKESSSHLQAVLKRQPANEKAQILLKKMVE